MEAKQAAALRRRQIDRHLENDKIQELVVPESGWIAEIRGAIGMRLAQIARRLGTTSSAISKFEKAEAEGSITLNSLRKVANAMDCRLVYALVPRSTLADMVEARAAVVARQIAAEVSHTMALEDQAVSSPQTQAITDEIAVDLVRTLPSRLWDDS